MAIILAIDDSLTDLTMIQYILSEHDLFLAGNGLEGLQKLSDNPEIDLILLDLRMPVLDGFGFLERFSTMGLDIPIMILTNAEEVEMEIHGLEMGAVDYI
ncbi:MAG: response regulator, partial [Spirochaetia bacterium]|nr:response regulator [Spirochaetia bacterium]